MFMDTDSVPLIKFVDLSGKVRSQFFVFLTFFVLAFRHLLYTTTCMHWADLLETFYFYFYLLYIFK